MLEIREKYVQDVPVFALVGSLAAASVQELQRRLLGALSQSSTIVLDLSELKYVSSAGVALFIKIGGRARDRGGVLRLVQPQKSVLETLAILRLDDNNLAFEIFPSVQDALKR